MKTKKPKKRKNPSDSTARNVKASNKRDNELRHDIRVLRDIMLLMFDPAWPYCPDIDRLQNKLRGVK